MTKKEAEELVEEFAQACIDYERADSFRVRRARDDYAIARDKLIAALNIQDGTKP